MKVEVSIGEAIDKLSILEIKLQNIADENKKAEIQKEINELGECEKYRQKYLFLYNLLVYINKKVWDFTDTMKAMDVSDEKYSNISKDIFDNNQKRFRIKNWFNQLNTSSIKEQKSYQLSYCKVIIPEEETIYDKIPEINYLLVEYDHLIFDTPHKESIQSIFYVPTYSFLEAQTQSQVDGQEVLLADFVIPSDEKREIFYFIPITYLSGGAFGDFIQQLSIINEKFYKTGRRGVIYISQGNDQSNYSVKGDVFRNGLENTYNDTYQVLTSQRYIAGYEIYNGQPYNINLNVWRASPLLFKGNWYYIFKQVYNVEWGKHPWLDVPLDPELNKYVVVNTTNYRWCTDLNFQIFYSAHKENLVFIGSDINQYNFFVQKTSLPIRYIKINNFLELCTYIKSCKLFVGGLSAPLAIAHAVNKNRICGKCDVLCDNIMVSGLDKLWPNFIIKK